MITFDFYTKNKITGVYEKVDGTVTPLSTEELLDEALDQAFIVISNTKEEIFEPTTEVKIVINQVGKASVEKYYIVGDDESTEFPIGTGFYTHKISLVERTKLLEGILCQSLSFTNALEKTWTATLDRPMSALTSSEVPNISSGVTDDIKAYISNIYKTPQLSGQKTVINAVTIASEIKAIIDTPWWTHGVDVYKESVKISVNGGEFETHDDYLDRENAQNHIVNANQSLRIKYQMLARYEFVNVPGRTYIESVMFEYNIEFSNQKIVTYPTKPWTITSGINRVLELAEPLFADFNVPNKYLTPPRFVLNPVQAEKWNNELMPETTMTSCTLREQLQHIGNYVHAQARLGGYYNGEYHENMIFFDEYGTEETSSIQGFPYVANVVKHSINEYNTHIDTSAQNIVNSLDYGQGVVVSPDAKNFKTVRTETSNLRLGESNVLIETELPIYDVTKILVKAYDGGGNVITVDGKSEFDITSFIYEQHEYDNLSSYEGTYPNSKNYAIYYTQGQKNINGLFMKAVSTSAEGQVIGDSIVDYTIANLLQAVEPNYNWKDYIMINFPRLAFQVSYIPFFQTRYSHTDGYILGQERNQPFSKIYNQSENVIEARFYGNNIKGVAMRYGNKESTRTYFLDDINNVPKTGSKLDNYYISSVVTEYMPQSIRCTVGLTENFNRISQNVGINSHKRVYEVSEKQAHERDILLKEYICIGDNAPLPFKDSILQPSVRSTVQMFCGTSDNEVAEDVLSVAQISLLTKSLYVQVDEEEFRTTITDIKIPVVASAFGNAMTFSLKMQDNYSAGTATHPESNGFWQTSSPCGDKYGRAYYMEFQLLNTLRQADNFDGASGVVTSFVTTGGRLGTTQNDRTYHPYILDKDSREAISMNIAVEYVTNRKDLVIHSALASCNPWVSNSKKDENGNIITPRVYFFADKLGQYEDTIIGKTDLLNSNVLVDPNVNKDHVCVRVATGIPKRFGSWCIAYPVTYKTIVAYNEDTGTDEEFNIPTGGEILVACNNSYDYYVNNNIEYDYLYIKPYSDKLKEYESE